MYSEAFKDLVAYLHTLQAEHELRPSEILELLKEARADFEEPAFELGEARARCPEAGPASALCDYVAGSDQTGWFGCEYILGHKGNHKFEGTRRRRDLDKRVGMTTS